MFSSSKTATIGGPSTCPPDWDADDLDRYLGGMAPYGRAAMLTVEPMEGHPDPLRVALDEATELMEGDAVDAAVVLYRAVCAHLGLPESHLADEQARMASGT